MGRPKNEDYWKQVTKLEDGKWQCERCKRKYKGGASRIKAHLDRLQGQGIIVCPIDPGSVRDNEGVDNNITAGSSNPQEAVNAMNPLEVAGGAHEMIGTNIAGSRNYQNDIESIYLLEGWAVPVGAVIGTGNSDLNQLVFDLTRDEDDVMGQLQWLESRGKKRKRQVDIWLDGVRDLKERYLCGSTDHWGQELPLQQLIEDVRKHNERKPLVLSNELVGKSFETNIKKMWELLGDDQVFIIGIHGMGGVGKTSLVTHIKNEITRKRTFKHVFWVTVSQDFSIFKLQSDIAKRIGVKLDEDDERVRAENLSLALETKEKPVLILDDVWKNIDLHKVGIPYGVNGIKLILTSRLEHVCQQMDCPPNNIIRMKPLSYEEPWELFLLKLGYHGTPATLPPEVFKIARAVAMQCHGLPLGISVMARTMKGVNGIHRWRHAWNQLGNSAMGEEMEEEVFKVLKLSYDNLMDKNMQNCFLHCALYHEIERRELIMNLVDEGLINGMRSLKEIIDEGRTILEKLTGHSLLLGNAHLDMPGLVRVMACHNILKEKNRYMVKCNKGLTKIPHMQEWTDDLEKISLMDNKIEEIPGGTSPMCPRLSTLIFSCNLLSGIPECFFRHMNALAVLDLSDNDNLISLPNSVSNLKSLVSLLLRGCESLKHVPPLGELHALSRLEISYTSIEEVPQGLEMLINLKWLDLSRNEELTLVPGFLLPGLTNMQYLHLFCESGSANLKVEDVREMSMLECFAGSFHDCENHNHYVRNTLDRGAGPKTYRLHFGIPPGNFWECFEDVSIVPENDKCQIVCFGDCEECVHLLPRDLAKLCIIGNNQWRCLCDTLSSDGPSSLWQIEIFDCENLESLFCLSGSCSLCTNLQNLESLELHSLESLDVIWKENDEHITKTLFSHLKHLKIKYCDNMEKLLTPGSLPQLQNLVTIEVVGCDSMKEIFAVRSNEDNGDDSKISLPKLMRLELSYLPQLKSVCRGTIVCGSSEILKIEKCPNLERRPTVQVFQF